MNSCSFEKKNNLSLVYYTSLGFMLGGDTLRLESNLKCLGLLDKYVEKFNNWENFDQSNDNL